MLSSLWRYYHRRLGHHERFHVAVILTIVVASYALVPRLVRLLQGLTGYHPEYYEPKDLERQEWAIQQGPTDLLPGLTWDVIFNIALFVVVAVVWLTLVPTRSPRRRPGAR